MTVEPNGLQRAAQLVNDAVDVALVSIFLIAATIFFLPGIQKRWSYAGAAFGMGTLLGVAVRWMDWPEGLVIVGAMVGVVAGPVTLLKLQGKSVFEIVEEIHRARRSGGGNREGE